MKKPTGYVAVPNWIIFDKAMYDTTKKILVTMLAYSDRKRSLCKAHRELAELSGCCRNTVAQAIGELQQRGLLFPPRRYYYSKRLSRIVRAKSRYILRSCQSGRSFTLVPRSLLQDDLTPAEFVIALHIYRISGRTGRCCPSLRLLAKLSDHAKATICRAVKQLQRRQAVSHLRCQKQNRAYSCNSYYPTDWVRKKFRRKYLSVTGGLKFEHPMVTKKITYGFTGLRTEKGVAQFGNMLNFSDYFSLETGFYRDGTAVRVFVTEEQF